MPSDSDDELEYVCNDIRRRQRFPRAPKAIADILGKTLEGNVHFTVLTDNPENIRAYTGRYSKWDIQPLHNRRQFPAIVRAISSIEPVLL